MDDKLTHWRRWIGRVETATDVIDGGRARAMQATLDDPGPPLADGDPLPLLWQWLYFWHLAPTAGLGAVDLPRRMWAGCRVLEQRPLIVGPNRHKAGVDCRHVYADSEGDCGQEDVDVAFHAPAGPAPGRPAPKGADWRLKLTPGPVLLFRYSALTFNGHRIHYDRGYATHDEGYDDVLVHGPLLATLLSELARRPGQVERPHVFECRAVRPCFAGRTLELAGAQSGAGAELWATDADGFVAMHGTVGWN